MNNSAITLVQITDCHLPLQADDWVHGFQPDQRLAAVTESLKGQYFDHLLLTGDLADPAAELSYQRLLKATSKVANHTHWIPGNHDDRAMMQRIMPHGITLIEQGNWAIVLLDSTFNPDGRGSGSLSEDEMTRIRELSQLEVDHILLVLHHPAFETNSQWQDAIKLANSDDFWRCVSGLDNVRAVLCGHLHQAHMKHHAKVALFSTPAVTAQFKTAQRDFCLEDDPALMGPAYRTLTLYPSGEIDSQVVRLPT